MSGELVRYDAMCSAIAAAYDVDEVKDIRDKALALERYAAQARNTEAERQACEIRLRAERRAGVLLRQMEKAKGGEQYHSTPNTVSGVPSKTLSDLGVSYKQSSDWQKLADVAEEDFETALSAPEKPTTHGIIESVRPKPQMDERALWLWGRLLDFERQHILDADPNDLFDQMFEHMQEATQRLAPIVAEWLRRIE